jgi:hypothetical protein
LPASFFRKRIIPTPPPQIFLTKNDPDRSKEWEVDMARRTCIDTAGGCDAKRRSAEDATDDSIFSNQQNNDQWNVVEKSSCILSRKTHTQHTRTAMIVLLLLLPIGHDSACFASTYQREVFISV